MQLKARGAWIEAAMASMLQSNRSGRDILVRAGATAMTDVTGFGLGGHLAEMVAASGVTAEVDLESVPALAGALACLDAGIRSTLHEGNERSATLVTPSVSPRAALLFDPQTSGGLLAGVPAARAAEVVSELAQAGYGHAAVIGEVKAGEPRVVV